MKKKLLLLTGALTVAALSVAIFAHKPMTAEEALLLANVEAIASGENDPCPGGNYPGRGCAIWDVTWTSSGGNTSAECKTGGSWECPI